MRYARSFAACLLCCLIAPAGFGQTPEITGANPGFLSTLTRSYRPHQVARISFEDSPRIEKLMRAGIIYLSLRDAIALALENNLDIEVARIQPKLADSNLLRASAGQLLRNVSSSISSGPSSASLGVAAGTNALGTNGGGTGSSNNGVLSGLNVQLAGSTIPNLDPVLYGYYQASHTTQPFTSTLVTGTNFLVTQAQTAIFGIQQGYWTGTTVSLGMNNTLGLSQNSPNNMFNPTTTASMQLQVTQNLLNGFGMAVNKRALHVAKNQLRTSDLTFQQQVIATVANVVNLYWDLVSFNEALKAKQQALDLDTKLYHDNSRRAELGALAGIDTIQAQAEMKAAQQEVTTQQSQVFQQEMILKSVLTRGGMDNATIALAHIVPTDRIEVPEREPVSPIQDLVGAAIAHRPELAQSQLTLENARINMLGTKSNLLPTLQAFATLQNNGLGGQVNSLPTFFKNPDGSVSYRPWTAADINPYFLGGYGTALGQIFGRNFPTYSAGLQLNIPLRNRAAQADLVTDELNYRQSQIQNKQLQNNIKMNVINNWIAVSQARAAYDTSVEASKLQNETLAGVERKYELGSTAILDVLIAQRDATARQLAQVDALAQYARARTNLEQAVGRILEEYNVALDEAKAGRVAREPDPIPAVLGR